MIALGTFVAGDDSALHALIRRFRAGDPDAYRIALEAAARALAEQRDSIPRPGLLVAVPAHSPSDARRPLDRLVSDLAAHGDWAAPKDPPLRRVLRVPEAKLGRTDPASLAASLRWTPPRQSGPIVLIDDVIRSGATIAACVTAIRATRPSTTVSLILGLARATGPDDGTRPPVAG
jgi:predicted amidophosphoribosyltransferase